jgi:hypothetical protein
MHSEISNHVLNILHEYAEKEGYDSYASMVKIAEHLKQTDLDKFRNVVKLLENRGLVRVVWLWEPLLALSEEGAMFIEGGNQIAPPQQTAKMENGPVTIDQSTHIYGNITSSAISIRSPGSEQTVKVKESKDHIIQNIVKGIENDPSLDPEQKSDLLIDANNLSKELEKSKPNMDIVTSYLSILGAISSIAGFVKDLAAWI